MNRQTRSERRGEDDTRPSVGRFCGVGGPLAPVGSLTNSIEVARTQVNSRELLNGGKMGNDRLKPMNYGEWSKSGEVARTFTPNSSAGDKSRPEEKILNRRTRSYRRGENRGRPSVGRLCAVGVPLAQQAAFSCDPHGDFAFRELKMKTHHESSKVRKHEKRRIEQQGTNGMKGRESQATFGLVYFASRFGRELVDSTPAFACFENLFGWSIVAQMA